MHKKWKLGDIDVLHLYKSASGPFDKLSQKCVPMGILHLNSQSTYAGKIKFGKIHKLPMPVNIMDVNATPEEWIYNATLPAAEIYQPAWADEPEFVPFFFQDQAGKDETNGESDKNWKKFLVGINRTVFNGKNIWIEDLLDPTFRGEIGKNDSRIFIVPENKNKIYSHRFFYPLFIQIIENNFVGCKFC